MNVSQSQPPLHNVVHSRFDLHGSTIVVMCAGTRLDVQVEARTLEGTDFSSQYNKLVEALERPEANDDDYENMIDWILHPCLSILKDVGAQTPQSLELTLQDFYFPSMLQVRLLVLDGKMTAQIAPYYSQDDIWSFGLRTDHSKMPPSTSVPRFVASTITIVSNEDHDCGSDIPRKVRTNDGKEWYFKDAFDKSEFEREVQSHVEIQQSGLQADLRISKLAGIVTSEDMTTTLGLLFEWIPSLGDLYNREVICQESFFTQWEDQVTATVKELHRHGIIWSAIYPGNIIIDKQMNAWVVGFGGGWVERFVTRRNCGSVEGDLLGIRNVFEYIRTPEAHGPQSVFINMDYNAFCEDGGLSDTEDMEHSE